MGMLSVVRGGWGRQPKIKSDMTQNRRILLNVVATYGRSLFALVCGLFTARWVLLALGREDFGLYGVVGGMTFFMTFFNGLMAGATSRFYAFSIGNARIALDKSTALKECRVWFNTALMVHTLLPTALIIVGYPLGEWVVRRFLVIQPDRLADCLWVFRFSALACLVAMVNVPFYAMYIAKQYIAELTIYQFLTTSFNVCFFYYMVEHPRIWLVPYAAWMCGLSIVPQILIAVRAMLIFPECSIRLRYWWNGKRVREMLSYGGWQAFAGVGSICRGQGMAILVNRFWGASVNASMSIANQVNGQTQMLASAMIGAFAPAITTACGAKDYDLMRRMAFRACKFGTVLVLLFALPLSLELREVMRLWLKEVPPFSVELCWAMMVVCVIDKTSVGHMLAVNANGKVALYQGFLGTALILTLPIAWGAAVAGCGVYSVAIGFVLATVLSAWGRVLFARTLVHMSVKYWIVHVLLPIIFAGLISGAAGWCTRFIFPPSFLRVCITTVCVESVFLPLVWCFVLDVAERQYSICQIHKLVEKLNGRSR